MKTPLIVLSVILVCAIVITLGACTNKNTKDKENKYFSVDYCGQKSCYSNAKKSYSAGSKVTLYYDLVATDTDYSFTLDGKEIRYQYDEKKGFVIEFIMPEHDVVLMCNARNSMTPYNFE